jgi:hypothetical protein
MSNSSSGIGGISFPVLLFIVFLVLKLTNYIDWSWWWITAPLWLPAGICVLILAIAYFILGGSRFWQTIFGR